MNSQNENNEKENVCDNKDWQQIKETGSVTPSDGKHVIHCLTIIGQIEGHGVLPSDTKTTKYEHVIPQLVAVEEDPRIEGMMIVLNTVGGDVEAGLALAELISGMKKTDCVIGARRRTFDRRSACGVGKMLFIVPSATMTIHPCGLTDWSLAFRRRCLILKRCRNA